VLDSLEVAAQVLAAKAFGAKDKALLNLTNKTLINYSIYLGIFLLLGLLALYSFGPELFTENPAVHDLLRSVWILLALVQVLNAVVFVTDGILMGVNDYKFLAIVQTISLVGLLIVLYFAQSLLAILTALAIWMIVRLIFQVWRVQIGLPRGSFAN
ncbi:MAG: MATE family efflux transporter, partial [Candidatus Nanopelagicales bacterium]